MFEIIITLLILFSVIVIGFAFYFIKNEYVIRQYLKLKSPTLEEKKIIDNIFEKNEFNKLIEIWISYKNTLIFLKIHLVVLSTGLFVAIVFFRIVQSNIFTLDTLINVIFVIPIILIFDIFRKIISDIYKIPEKKLINSTPFLIFMIIVSDIPLLLLLILIELYNLELNINTALILCVSLTIGMYEYIKRIIGFLLPIPESGIYSTEELIQQIMSAKEGKTNIMKEIVDNVSK